MDFQLYIPQDKSDDSHIEQLKKLTADEIAPIMAGLLEWTQDYNWPISREIIDIVIQFQEVAIPHMLEILQPDPHIFQTICTKKIDGKYPLFESCYVGIWKYWLIGCVIPFFTKENQEILLPSIQRIALCPTEVEITEEASEVAQDYLNNYHK